MHFTSGQSNIKRNGGHIPNNPIKLHLKKKNPHLNIYIVKDKRTGIENSGELCQVIVLQFIAKTT